MCRMRKKWVAVTLSLLFLVNSGCNSSSIPANSPQSYDQISAENLLLLSQVSQSIPNLNMASIHSEALQFNSFNLPSPNRVRKTKDESKAATTERRDNVPFEFSKVKWLHTNVSSWKRTATLKVSVSGSSIDLNYSKATVWPAKKAVGVVVNANPWIFVQRNGTWYAATWEWLRPGQTKKARRSVAGDHIKRSPLQNFSPRGGETYGFMVSGLARDSTRNVKERSEIVMMQWPGGASKKAAHKVVTEDVNLLGKGAL